MPEFNPEFDVVIVGGGPAGLAAALLLGRVRRDALVCDTGHGRNAAAAESHGTFTRDGVAPEEMRSIGRKQLAPYPSVQVVDVGVDDVRSDSSGFVATLDSGQQVRTRRVLLATGLTDDLPAVEGLPEVWGRSAFNCPYCDGWETQGKTVAVLAAGDHALRFALQLMRFTTDLTVCTDGPENADDTVRGVLNARQLGLRTEPIARLDHDDGRLRAVEFEAGTALRCDVAFVAAPYRQRSELPASLRCQLFDDGTVAVDDFGRTSVPGVYAAGDLARPASLPSPLAQVQVAATNGQLAAGMIDQELLMMDLPDFPSPLPPAVAS